MPPVRVLLRLLNMVWDPSVWNSVPDASTLRSPITAGDYSSYRELASGDQLFFSWVSLFFVCEFSQSGWEDCRSVLGNGWGLLWLCSSDGGDAFLHIHGMLECTFSPFRFWWLPQFLSKAPLHFLCSFTMACCGATDRILFAFAEMKTDYWGGRGREVGEKKE